VLSSPYQFVAVGNLLKKTYFLALLAPLKTFDVTAHLPCRMRQNVVSMPFGGAFAMVYGFYVVEGYLG
jgi:hypothetical protein